RARRRDRARRDRRSRRERGPVVSVATGLVVDRALGEPPAALHPVALFGSLMQRIEARTYSDSRVRGAGYTLAGASLGVIAAGAPGALGYRAVNTMDAMVGHRSTRYARFGWASARLDDAANFVPARATAMLVVLVRPGAATAIRAAVRNDARAHPPPNAGVAEAAFAAALGVQLGGPLRYGTRTERRPLLGRGPRPEPADIERAIVLA